jgi:phosphoenolpyruvate synthase/pyruvate phosphate dikinase
VAASMGVTTGPVRMVLNDGDLRKVKKGDIVCTYSCSASFNCVVGLCAGIVTDYGGMLSHAAIVAREYGIPAIVGSQQATAKFKDGDIVKIDSSTATVSLVERK